MQRVRIWLSTAGAKGGDELRLRRGGALVAGTRRIAVRAAQAIEHFEERSGGPPAVATASRVGEAVEIETPPLGPGLHTFTFQPVDGVGSEGGESNELSVYVNTYPLGVAGVRPVSGLVSGRLRFTYQRIEEV